MIDDKLNPYIVFLPAEQKSKTLSAIFGSRAAVDILRYSLNQGIANKIYQRELVRKLSYSNKTIIENLKSLTRLGILREAMEKTTSDGRTVWIKAYHLSDEGKWFALLLAEEKHLSSVEKSEILQNIFRGYIRWVRKLSEDLHVSNLTLKKIFNEEMK